MQRPGGLFLLAASEVVGPLSDLRSSGPALLLAFFAVSSLAFAGFRAGSRYARSAPRSATAPVSEVGIELPDAAKPMVDVA